jgi:hypothetical protein
MKDNQRLVGAKTRFGNVIPTYDDGFGPLWIHRNSMGISGIVRAQTWEDAYSTCEDEFFPAADEEAAADRANIDTELIDEEASHLQACWDEAYGYRGNTRRMPDGTLSSIYARDLNGEALDLLTPELIAELGLTLTIETEFDYQVIDHGIEHCQYFQGCGVSFTRFDHCVTGCGSTPLEAFDDALEQIESTELIAAIEASDDYKAAKASDVSVYQHLVDAGEIKDGDDLPDMCELHYYISIRYSYRP